MKTMKKLEPRDCHLFQNCSSPLCPLDDDWRKRASHPDEDNCRVLLASVRPATRSKVKAEFLAACDAMAADPNLPLHVKAAIRKAKKWGESKCNTCSEAVSAVS